MEHAREGQQCGVSEGNVVGKYRIGGKGASDRFCAELVEDLTIAYPILIRGGDELSKCKSSMNQPYVTSKHVTVGISGQIRHMHVSLLFCTFPRDFPLSRHILIISDYLT